MAKPQASIWVDLNEKPALEALKRLSKAFKDNATDINQSLELVKKGYNFVVGGISDLISAQEKYIQKAIEAEHVERRAIAALTLRGKFTDENFESLKNFNSALSQELGISGKSLLQLQGSLTARGVSNDKIKEATKATIGLAEATGKDLNDAGVMVAKVFNGNTTALSKMGIKVDSAAEGQKRLAQMFALAEAQAGTLETQVKRLDVNFNAFDKNRGETFTRSEALRDAMSAFNDVLVDLNKIMSSDESKLAMDSFFRTMLGWIGALGAALDGFYLVMKDVFKSREWRLLMNVSEARSATNSTILGVGVGILKTNAEDDISAAESRADFSGPPAAAKAAGALDKIFDSIQTFSDRLSQIGGRSGALLAKPKPSNAGLAQGSFGGEGGSADLGFSADDLLFGISNKNKRGPGFTARDPYLDAQKGLKGFNQEDLIRRVGEPFEAYRKELQHQQELTDLQIQTDTANSANKWIESFQNQAVVMVQGFGGMLSGMIQEIVSGSSSLLQGVGHLFGGLMIQMGQFLIQLGTVGVLAGTLGTVIPALKLLTGGELGIAAGAAAIVGGSLMVAAGSALGGSGHASVSRPSAGGGGGGGSFRTRGAELNSSAPQGFAFSDPSKTPANTVVNISFNRPVTNERRTAREIEDLLRKRDILRAS